LTQAAADVSGSAFALRESVRLAQPATSGSGSSQTVRTTAGVRLVQTASDSSTAQLTGFQGGTWDGAGIWDDPSGQWDGTPLPGPRVSVRLPSSAADSSTAGVTVHAGIRFVQPVAAGTAATVVIIHFDQSRVHSQTVSASDAEILASGYPAPGFRLSIGLPFFPYSFSDAETPLRMLASHPVYPDGYPRVPNYAGAGRENLYAYLAALLQQNLQLSSLRRGYPVWSQLNPRQSPIGFLHVANGTDNATAWRENLPPVYRDEVTLWVGVVQPSGDVATVNETPLMALRDVLDGALLPDQPDRHGTTLGGRAISVAVVEDFYEEGQGFGSWTSFVARLEVRYISPLNR
jgi:hypothetical protein